jgi:hypothetical protein
VKADRRRFIKAVTAVAAALSAGRTAILSPAVAQSADDDVSTDMLARIAYRLFPHPNLGQAPYARVAAAIAADAGSTGLVRDGLAALDAMQENSWLDRSESQQVADLEAIESGAFFQYMLAQTKSRLYTDREVWAFLGYGGSSMAFGGYIDRGLNDIDWLEEA